MSDNKFLLNGILIFSILSLSIAYFIQYILGHKPCNLCLIERIPYLSAVVLVSLIFIIRRFEIVFSTIVLIFFIFGGIISFYHVGIEQGFFEESAVCGLKNASEILSREEILKQLQLKTVSCKDVTFRIFGFSLTTFNIIISLILIIFLLKIFVNYEKSKK